MKWLAIIFIFLFRKIIFKILIFIIIIIAVLYFSFPFLTSYYIGKVADAKISNSFSYSKLIKGTVEFKTFRIYSTADFNNRLAIEFTNLIIDFDLLSLPSSTKVIKSINSDKVNIYSINKNTKNNISEIVRNIQNYYKINESIDEKTGDYLVKELNLNDIYLSTYNDKNKLKTTKLSDIHSTNITSNGIVLIFLKSILFTIHDKVKHGNTTGEVIDKIWDVLFGNRE